MDLSLDTPVQYIPRVGPVMSRKLAILGIETVEDLLLYAPFRYDDFSVISPISQIRIGDAVTIAGTVDSIANIRTKTGKKMQTARVSDNTGTISVVWFNQPFLLNTIKKGAVISFAGKVGWFGTKQVLESPVYELGSEPNTSLNMARLVPIYSETAGISSKWLRGRIDFVIKQCIQQVFEYIHDSILKKYQLMEIQKSIEYIHFPIDKNTAEEARRRLAFDELFIALLRSCEQKRLWQTTQTSYVLTIPKNDIASFVKNLPFSLTSDQIRTLDEILGDLTKPFPMNRLLEGDVGSGKTVVAAIAMYATYRNGLRSILMAPTQILAEQHFATVKTLFDPLGIKVGLATGSKKIWDKQTPVIIGTHALLAESIPNIGLVVIDEQHRFGVKQRSQLMQTTDKKTPHLLTMTATPIPRTVARTIYGNVDLSVLETMPQGRSKVKTWVVPKEKRDNAYEWIKNQLKKTGGQAFIVCPLIEESETLQTVKAVKTEFARLKNIFTDVNLGLLHGRLKPQEKTDVLNKFRNNTIQILVATPVVEVGIDVANAMIMMIEASERFGLSQLHQLRGRVGRGTLASYCLLFTDADDPIVTSRLKSLETIYSGPKLAEVDLHLRGPGELFGTKQHGVPFFKIATLSDTQLIAQAQEATRTVTDISSDLSQFPQLREKVKKCIIEGLQD